MEKVSIVIDGKSYEYEKGTTFKKIAEDFKELYDAQIAVCIFNGKIRELVKKADKDGNLEFITVKHPIGHKTYIRTATMMMLKALYDVLGKEHVGKAKIEFEHVMTHEKIEFEVSGEKLQYVTIPVGYQHSINNIGEDELVLILWANELFDKDVPDTFVMEG